MESLLSLKKKKKNLTSRSNVCRYWHLIHLATVNMCFLCCWYGGQEIIATCDLHISEIRFNIPSPFVKKAIAEMFEFRMPLVDT